MYYHKRKNSFISDTTVVGILLLAIVIFSLIFFINIYNQTKNVPESKIRNVYIGFWTQGFWDNKTQSINPESLKSVESQIGKKVAIANYYQGWEYLSNSRIINDLNIISENGWRPMISANPYFFNQCHANGMTLYQAIAHGNCDSFLHKVGKTLSKVKEPFFLRFAWEMNINSMEWSITDTGDTSQEFIAAWKRFHDIVKEEGAKQILWVFCPQVETPTETEINKLYPGDSYVDWNGLDGYNWGTTKSWSTWESFDAIFHNSYYKFLKIAPKKPIMIAEVNTTNIGGDQAEWYHDMLLKAIPNIYTKVNAIVFFNEDKTSSEGVKWLIANTSSSLKQFKQAISNPIYKSEF